MPVRFADDAVVMCRSRQQAQAALARLRQLLAELGLEPAGTAPETSPGAVFMLDGHVFGHISLAHHLTFFLISWTSRAPASSDVPCTIADTMSQYVSCDVAALTRQPSRAVSGTRR